MLKSKYLLTLGCVIAFSGMFAGCSDDDKDFIPPALDEIEDPEEPVENEYNVITFTPHVDGQPYDTYRGLVMAGYQGWFGAPGDGCKHNDATNTQWYHYRESEMFKPGVLRNSIDLWPDMKEYTKKYDTDFVLPDGGKAQVYSAYDESSVLLHFKWMKEYGIDGVFMQRFVGEVIDNAAGKDHFDKVLSSAMKGSDQYQRAIAVMYDLGGYNPGRLEKVVNDARMIYDTYATTRKFYLHENNKPLLALWGVGFNPKERNYTNGDVQALVDELKKMGYSIMLGVTTNWRGGGGDTYTQDLQALHALIRSVDVIMPWYVGRYSNSVEYATGGSDGGFPNMIANDLAWCKTASQQDGVNVLFAPHCFPGASDLNMHPYYSRGSREHGNFFWNQMYGAIKKGCEMLYIAMFDEIDEGTAIYKVMNKSKVPSNEAEEDYYVVYNPKNEAVDYVNMNGGNGRTTNTVFMSKSAVNPVPTDGWCQLQSEMGITFEGIDDDLPTDYYLWLTGTARKMLNAEIPMSETIPARE
ncbi:MAG: glycoside hydrolase family 71/99-like protein [Muribaculum sp.]|nr:glycoside hydrolase family 71/99-like protein [Muribaculum sp.]